MLADWLYDPAHDRLVAQAIGMVITGSLLLMAAGLHLTKKAG